MTIQPHKDSPHLGSLVSKMRPSSNGLPEFAGESVESLPSSSTGGEAPGQHGGWLGSAHDGMLLTGDLNDLNWRPQGLALPADIGLDQLESRVALLKNLDERRSNLHRSLATANYSNQYKLAR